MKHPQRRAFIAALVVGVVILSALAGRGRSTSAILTGTVVASRAGEWISVVNPHTDPEGIAIAVRDKTAYMGRAQEPVDPRLITPGTPVTVWYRFVWERRPVADRVRVLPD